MDFFEVLISYIEPSEREYQVVHVKASDFDEAKELVLDELKNSGLQEFNIESIKIIDNGKVRLQ